jgi:predicted RecB family endonuclease
MAGKSTRAKGRRGESEAKVLLLSRDWTVADLSAGLSSEDLLAIDSDGKTWAVEVKNTSAIMTAHREQAMQQAKARKAPWMLMSKIAGTSSWLIQRQGKQPVVWSLAGEL